MDCRKISPLVRCDSCCDKVHVFDKISETVKPPVFELFPLFWKVEVQRNPFTILATHPLSSYRLYSSKQQSSKHEESQNFTHWYGMVLQNKHELIAACLLRPSSTFLFIVAAHKSGCQWIPWIVSWILVILLNSDGHVKFFGGISELQCFFCAFHRRFDYKHFHRLS